MSMWTAPSDLDYYFGHLPPSENPDGEERDPKYEQWLADHGYFDAPNEDDFERMLAEQREGDLNRLRENFERAPLVQEAVDDDISF